MGLVSVIIPAYNAAKYIRGAICSALEQSYPNIEVVVVNDGSSDSTRDILREFKDNPSVQLLEHEGGVNKGVSESRRLAVLKCKGDFVAFLDADDEFLPTKIEKHISHLMSNETCVLVHGYAKVFDELNGGFDERTWWEMDSQGGTYNLADAEHFLRTSKICNSTVICRREFLTDDVLPVSMVSQFEDWYLWVLLGFKGKFYFDPEPLTLYRYHSESFTAGQIGNRGAFDLYYIELLLSLLPKLEQTKHRRFVCDKIIETLLQLSRIRIEVSGCGSSSSEMSRSVWHAKKDLMKAMATYGLRRTASKIFKL